MTMSRSLRACRLTAGKFAAVDLPTFLAVCHILFLTLRKWQTKNLNQFIMTLAACYLRNFAGVQGLLYILHRSD